MTDQPKSSNEEEKEMRRAFAGRLKELISEAGGNAKFIEKLDKIRPKGLTDVRMLGRWIDPEKDIQLKNAYLIAVACNVSSDWLLGLSAEKSRSGKSHKLPATYGDVLSVLDSLSKINVLGIADSSHWLLDLEIYDKNGVTLPKYIRIKDANLIDLIRKLSLAREFGEKQAENAWKITLKKELNKPIQPHGYNPRNNGGESGQVNSNEISVPAKLLDDDALKKQVSERLGQLQNDLSCEKFGEKIGASKSTVSGWFYSHLPKTYCLYKIAKVYCVRADWILGLDEAGCAAIPWEDETYTYGSVLLILKHLIDKGTICFVDYYSPSFQDPDDSADNENTPIVDDLLIIDDKFLYYLLLQKNKLERYSIDAFKEMYEDLINKYKDTHLLSFEKNMRHDSCEIIGDLWNGKTNQDIDPDELYKDLQRLSDQSL